MGKTLIFSIQMSAVGDIFKNEPKINLGGQKLGVISTAIAILIVWFVIRIIRKKTETDRSEPPPPPSPGPLENLGGDKVQAALDRSFWRRYANTPGLITWSRALNLAENIYDAKGFFNDDEELVRASILSAGSIVNMSRVTDAFETQYNRSLQSYLFSFLNNRELQTYVIGPIESLPWLRS